MAVWVTRTCRMHMQAKQCVRKEEDYFWNHRWLCLIQEVQGGDLWLKKSIRM